MTHIQNPEVGMIGLGAMGYGDGPVSFTFRNPGKGTDINPQALEKFAKFGGNAVDTAAQASTGVDILILVVVNAVQVEDVLFGAGAAAEALPKGSVVMICSTVKPDFARKMAGRLEAMALEMLDAPISGGAAKAAAGNLSIMASGRPSAFEKTEPALEAMAENVYRLGDRCGQGSTVKMINQLLAGVHIAAAAEAVAFGVRAGVEARVLYDVISHSAGSSWMFQNRVPHMIQGDYTPLSAVDIFVKDLGIVLEAGKEQQFPLPLSAAAHQLFLMAAAAGLGKEDDSAVVKVFEQLANINVTGCEE